jgi:hypothetical protein
LGKSLDSGFRRNDEIIANFQAFLPPANPFSSFCQSVLPKVLREEIASVRATASTKEQAVPPPEQKGNPAISETQGLKKGEIRGQIDAMKHLTSCLPHDYALVHVGTVTILLEIRGASINPQMTQRAQQATVCSLAHPIGPGLFPGPP